jgi:hypothetical protein
VQIQKQINEGIKELARREIFCKDTDLSYNKLAEHVYTKPGINL